MDKVKLAVFYQFGAAMQSLKSIKAGDEMDDLVFTLVSVQRWISTFLVETMRISLPLSKRAAKTLLTAMSSLGGGLKSLTTTDGKLEIAEVSNLHKALDEFETVFRHETENLDVFSVPQKGAYSTTTLIERGEAVIPKPVRDYIPQYAREELHEVGRCIAFNLPTAAGFHLMRCLESVLHSYWDVVSGGKPRPTLSNGQSAAMGAYIAEVEKEGADKKTVAVLRQIKDLHRNPLMHPDAVLSTTDATILLGLVPSAVMAMVEEMKKKGAMPYVHPPSPSQTP